MFCHDYENPISMKLRIWHRMSYFAYVSSLSYVFALLGPIIASATMSRDLWLPFYLGIGLLVGALPIVMFLPRPATEDDRQRFLNASVDDATEQTPLIADPSSQASDVGQKDNPSILQKLVGEVRVIRSLILGRPNFQQLIIITILLAIASSNTSVLVLYLSKRYNRTFESVRFSIPRNGLY